MTSIPSTWKIENIRWKLHGRSNQFESKHKWMFHIPSAFVASGINANKVSVRKIKNEQKMTLSRGVEIINLFSLRFCVCVFIFVLQHQHNTLRPSLCFDLCWLFSVASSMCVHLWHFFSDSMCSVFISLMSKCHNSCVQKFTFTHKSKNQNHTG